MWQPDVCTSSSSRKIHRLLEAVLFVDGEVYLSVIGILTTFYRENRNMSPCDAVEREKSNGPRTDPCGVAVLQRVVGDDALPTFTNDVRSARYDLTQLSAGPVTPKKPSSPV